MAANAVPSSIIVDVDGTLCPIKAEGEDYADLPADAEMVRLLGEYRERGFRIVLYSARNMRTHDGRIGLITKHTAPVLIAWLERHHVPYDELILGKPWPGPDGFYVDDRTVRPDEFKQLPFEELQRRMVASRST